MYKNVLLGIDSLAPFQNFTGDDRDLYVLLKFKALNEKFSTSHKDLSTLVKDSVAKDRQPFHQSEHKSYVDKLVSESGASTTAIFTSQINAL